MRNKKPLNYNERCTGLGKRERLIYDYLAKWPNRWIPLGEISRACMDGPQEWLEDRDRLLDKTRKSLHRLAIKGLVKTTRYNRLRGELRAMFVQWKPRTIKSKI
jgi:hypothetical protein